MISPALITEAVFLKKQEGQLASNRAINRLDRRKRISLLKQEIVGNEKEANWGNVVAVNPHSIPETGFQEAQKGGSRVYMVLHGVPRFQP
jgi:hypothetical protein